MSQDRFRTVNPAFYRGANGIVVVYDVTNKESYDRIDGWMKEALQYAQEPRTLLIGNKADLEPRQVCSCCAVRLRDFPSARFHVTSLALLPPVLPRPIHFASTALSR